MNFIRLPSLKLNHAHYVNETLTNTCHDNAQIGSISHSNKSDSHSAPSLPPTWKHDHHHYHYPPQQNHFSSSSYQEQNQQQLQSPISSSLASPLGLRFQPQNYAQEMFSFAALPECTSFSRHPLSTTDAATPTTISITNANKNHYHNHDSSDVNTTMLVSRKRRRRPPHSYASMIAQAILTSKEQKMTLKDIYQWVQQRYPHLYETNETGWQNTIRHNLSLNRCFYKLPKSAYEKGRGRGKGGYWAVSTEQLNNTTFGRHLLDTGGCSSAGFEYWLQEPPVTATTTEEDENDDDDREKAPLSADNNGDIFSFAPVSNFPTVPSATSTAATRNLTLQPANLATLQDHQIHLQQRRVVPLPPTLSIPYDQYHDYRHYHNINASCSASNSNIKNSISNTNSNNTELDNPTFHPPSLHHILN